MPDPDIDARAGIQAEVRAQAIALLDAQIDVLSDRLFEAGKNADQHLTGWATLTSLAALLLVGAAGEISIGGLQLSAMVAASVCFIGSCAFYYRACLGFAAIATWRGALRERRLQRFAPILALGAPDRPSDQAALLSELNAYVPEYPGFVASSVLLRDEARKVRGWAARIVVVAHYLAVALFVGAHWLLALGLLIRTGAGAGYVVVVLLGLTFALAGNQLTGLGARKNAAV
jgi:hypothetical protein